MLKAKNKICIIGHFAHGEKLLNGQTIKTQVVTDELMKIYGKKQITLIDTHGGLKKLCILPFELLSAIFNSEHIIIFPAQNGLRIIAPILAMYNFIFNRKLHYVVIGGWLPKFLNNKMILTKIIKKFHYIYVETNVMKKMLNNLGFKNVIVMHNFKDLDIVRVEDINKSFSKPFRFCMFSRVMREKGIEDSVNAVVNINTKCQDVVCTLDIYGAVDINQEDWFNNLKATFPDYIQYKGTVEFNKSTQVLREYFALLFPTHFYTEGIPGTIIDAYAAGIPVISAKWKSCTEVVEDKKTGYIYEFDNLNQFENLLLKAINDPKRITELKANCLEKAKKFTPNNVISVITENLN